MHELSLQNIDQINNDIRNQEITFSHLLEDLIDHICCDVESEMQNGLAFSDAYHRVKQKMGSRRLKEIQEETLYEVDKKYRKMKNTMKISGVAGTIMFGFAALFKIQHWPGAGFMMTLGAVTLAFVFIPSALGVLWKETHSRNRLFLFISAFLTSMFFILGTVFKIQHWSGAGILLSLTMVFVTLFFMPALLASILRDQENKSKRPVYILGAAGFIFYVAGMLFKIQHWPLAGLLMVLGLIILCVFTFPWYTWLKWKEENHISSQFLFIVIGSLAIIVPGALVNLNLQYSYEDGFYTHLGQQQVMYNYMYGNNNSVVTRYHDSLSYPQIEQLHSRTAGLLSLISNIQAEMVRESEGKPGNPAVSPAQVIQTETGTEIQYRHLTKPFHPGPVRDFLLPGSSSRQELNTALTEYMKFIPGLTPGEDLQKYLSLLEPSKYLPGEIPEGGVISLMSGLHSLELLKNSLLTVESYILTNIARH